MILHDYPQGSDEWLRARLGIPTASRFGDIFTSQGKPSASQGAYINQLVSETLFDRPAPVFQTEWMKRGNDLEPEARDFYAFQRDVTVTECGFVKTSCGSAGGSPDGLTPDGGVEIKCPKEDNHVDYLLKGKCPAKYFPQVMGLMWLFERDHWDFVSYHPDCPRQLIVRVDRDDMWIKGLVDELDKFTSKLAKAKQKLGV